MKRKRLCGLTAVECDAAEEAGRHAKCNWRECYWYAEGERLGEIKGLLLVARRLAGSAKMIRRKAPERADAFRTAAVWCRAQAKKLRKKKP